MGPEDEQTITALSTASRLHSNKRSGKTDQPRANDKTICLLLLSDAYIFKPGSGKSAEFGRKKLPKLFTSSGGLRAWWGAEQLSLWIIRPGF